MKNTKQVWAYEYELEEGERYTPLSYNLPHDSITPAEFVAYDVKDNEIYWHKNDKLCIMSRDYAKQNYPKIYQRFKHYKYE